MYIVQASGFRMISLQHNPPRLLPNLHLRVAHDEPNGGATFPDEVENILYAAHNWFLFWPNSLQPRSICVRAILLASVH